MGKVLDPIVVNPPKPNSTQPFNREDIEKIAFNVLADLGDEVINKAIQEGKITIPTGLGLIWMDDPEEEIGDERFEKLLTGKYCIGGISDGSFMLYIPYYTESTKVMFYRFNSIGEKSIELYYYGLTNSETTLDNMYNGENGSIINSGTKLYLHVFTGTTDSNTTTVRIINTSSDATNNMTTFAKMCNDYMSGFIPPLSITIGNRVVVANNFEGNPYTPTGMDFHTVNPSSSGTTLHIIQNLTSHTVTEL